MMVIKKIGILTLLILLSLGTTAQTIVWKLKPTDYSGIERFGPDLYQVKKDGKIGLIRSDGSVVIPIGYTEMTGFYEHKALVLNDESDSDGNPRILGYLTDEGRYVQFFSSYFSLKGLAFYSDGMLPVNDAKGRRGYLDERGSSVLGFDGKWSSIMPFTEGHAVVFTGKKGDLKYHLIDKDGNYARFLLGNGIELYGGKNVYNGKAMVWDTNGKFYNYDVLTGKCSSSKQPANKQNDYLYCFIDITGRGKTAPYNTFPVGHKGLEPVAEGGMYGFTENGKVILPYQFSQATPFEDGLAIVNLQGQYGILRYVRGGEDFAVSVPKSHFVYDEGGSVDCAFQLTVPEAWSRENLEVAVVDKVNGEQVTLEKSAGIYSFKLKPNNTERSYNISVASEGLALWSGEASYTFKKKEVQNLRASLSIGATKADANDKVYVTATITNPGKEAVTATISMTGSSAFNNVSRTETIAAGGSTKITSYFTVTSNTLKDQHVSVSTSKGGRDSKSGLTLTPFYE